MRVDDRWTNDFAVLMRQITLIPPGDAFFFYPYSPMLPYLTGRRHAAPLDVMPPGYTDAAQFRATCVQVVREAQVARRRSRLDQFGVHSQNLARPTRSRSPREAQL